jgi:putative flippase GtrA
MVHLPHMKNFIQRASKYGVVGFGTYLLDLSIVYILNVFFFTPLSLAIAIGFLIGVSINFLISYHWAFAGTKQTKEYGYLYFIGIALCGALGISFATTTLIEISALPLVISRTIVALCVGTVSFVLNARYNFRVL